ncbi:CMP-N-acetylneuraminic acid synthetase [Flavobacterium croceum DSM 17960]|uniref:CMP-N-acetylneuraminic acid synthetase n=1 Tax=Flavobacterium croceum DSM 17960 TaxID=1121886 RepID=A0A2S4N9H5_9FLAO|nr:acylneuraminate cytidylyltransferase family protein [Flavobacterium croceum]POS02338.1 CMP-N-acetylneuraminic acid synthetase [Flavobacterium croceum DSM 17960]
MSKTIVIIPARAGSKRLPNKNTLLLQGIPLVAHSILYAKQFSFIDDIFVTTNDSKVKEIALQYNAKVIDRPEELSGNNEPTVSALKHALEFINNVEHVVLLQPTNPLRPSNLLFDAFEIYQKQGLESLFTVSRSWEKLGKIVDNQFLSFNYTKGQRSQDLEPLYYENGLLYIAKASLIKKDILISDNAYPLEVNHIYAKVDIDTQDDFDYAAYLLQKANKE